MANERITWTSRIGFVLASAGAAVGLGAIWKFPYMAGTNGGSVFLFPYILLTFTVGLALLIAEIALGRLGKGGIVTTYRRLAGKAFLPAGYLGVVTGFLVLSFYSAIGGWTLSYFCEALVGQGLIADQSQLGAHFAEFTANPVTALGFQWLFLVLNGLIVAFDVTKGIERVSKILMPLLFILMLVVIVRGLMLPGAMEGVRFLFKPDPEAFTGEALLNAMGFAFFSLSVGSGSMMNYGSYLSDKVSIGPSTAWIVCLAVMASILGGLMIMPAVFAFGLSPDAGPGLTFATMPAVFGRMPFGDIFAVAFFLCLFVAALTSAISILEMTSQHFVDRHGLKRRTSVLLVSTVLGLIGIVCALSFGPLSDVKLFGKTAFDLLDYVTSNIGMPIGCMGIAFVACFVSWKTTEAELSMNASWRPWALRAFRLFAGILAPLLILVVAAKGIGLF